MNRLLIASRVLLSLSAAIFLIGAVMHAGAFFSKAKRVIDGSSLMPVFSGELKVLWLADSTTLFGLALVLALIAARPACASGAAIFVLSLIPAATAGLLYFFLGNFFAAHMLLAATLMVIASALLQQRVANSTRSTIVSGLSS